MRTVARLIAAGLVALSIAGCAGAYGGIDGGMRRLEEPARQP